LSDTWIKVKNPEIKGARIRYLDIVKSRGMGHSNLIWNFFIDDLGIHLKRTKNKSN
jgi:circadian clock protein KaiC